MRSRHAVAGRDRNGLSFAVDRRWLVGDPAAGREKSAAALGEALCLGAETFERYGPVLRAISDAASYDERAEETYRFGLIERLISAARRSRYGTIDRTSGR